MAVDGGGGVMPHAVHGTVHAPPSKSLTHRAYLLAAQSDVPCTIHAPLPSLDTDAMLGAMRALGARCTIEPRGVTFEPATLRAPAGVVQCGNSGTALRLLLGTAARLDAPVTLDGDASLRRRPNGPILQALETLGATTSSQAGACPMTVQGPMQPGAVTLPANVSSQYASSLLLNLPLLDGPSTIQLEEPVASRPYLDLTMQVAHHFGLHLQNDGNTFHVEGCDRPSATEFRVEGDWSSAAFLLVAAAIAGGDVTVQGLDNESLQADRRLLNHLNDFGAKVHASSGQVRVQGERLVSPGTVDVSATPDLFPALCVLAACSQGATTITGGMGLRTKESDRITAMAQGLHAVGIQVEERPDGLVVHGGTPTGGAVHAYDDHRIHMAFQTLALAATGAVHVDGAETVAVSYPQFPDHLRQLTGGSP